MASKKRANSKDDSPYVNQDKKREMNIPISEKIPWTQKQKSFIYELQKKSNQITFLVGPAGTSKTILAVYAALQMLKEKRFSDIIYIRSVVESGSTKMGFLPGAVEDKLAQFVEPFRSKLDELLGEAGAKKIFELGFCSAKPINYLRGSHFAGKIIIADEMQNMNEHELLTLLTRVGEFTKLIICGDTKQSDIGNRSGLNKFIEVFDNLESQDNGINVLRFDSDDIVRSKIVRYIVSTLEKIGI